MNQSIYERQELEHDWVTLTELGLPPATLEALKQYQLGNLQNDPAEVGGQSVDPPKKSSAADTITRLRLAESTAKAGEEFTIQELCEKGLLPAETELQACNPEDAVRTLKQV
jgi:hypothetical protein